MKARSIEASDLGWPPGVWPPVFTLDGNNWYREGKIWASDYEFGGYEYSNPRLGTLKVWND